MKVAAGTAARGDVSVLKMLMSSLGDWSLSVRVAALEGLG
eukprot:CAMPEP_0197689150 /NCGR_PEP_ID=MMETSP1338-20131121/106442_1 /TAXON_ID=43686 ORGANISM="Pelagodinium beii, Strain RCC1491" /NCGR_SAMPLE_ID=MMETSP1338 /ASSEMBLY_ACC=CAM_ASM_000754 /LENGTH=39 /DNA_ID= /DNA_START= /DNA_END= /DNA_ORIENTATION=